MLSSREALEAVEGLINARAHIRWSTTLLLAKFDFWLVHSAPPSRKIPADAHGLVIRTVSVKR